MSDETVAIDAPTFCEATCTCKIDGYYEEVRCIYRYGHEEEHCAKIWWSADERHPNGGTEPTP